MAARFTLEDENSEAWAWRQVRDYVRENTTSDFASTRIEAFIAGLGADIVLLRESIERLERQNEKLKKFEECPHLRCELNVCKC